MKMRIELATELQSFLTIILLDECLSPAHLVVQFPDLQKNSGSNLHTDEGRREWWQETVDLIARLLIADIVSMHGVKETDRALELVKHDLANHDPYGWPADGIEWSDQQLWPTTLCSRLCKKHDVDRWNAPFSRPFIEEIESLFERAGVPIGKTPLIPIRKKH